MNDEYNGYDGGMLSGTTGRRSKLKNTKIPNFGFIFKVGRRTKRLPSSNFANIMAVLTIGMLFIFPLIVGLIMFYPEGMLSIFGMIVFCTWLFSQRIKYALIILGLSLVSVLLGLVTIAFFYILTL